MVYGDNEGTGRRGYRVGNLLWIAMANDFFRPVNGIYGVMELQPEQVNWGSINPQPLPGAVRLWLWSVFAGGPFGSMIDNPVLPMRFGLLIRMSFTKENLRLLSVN